MTVRAPRIALRRFLAAEGRRAGGAGRDVAAVLLDVAAGVKQIAALLARGAQAPASEILLRATERSGRVAAVACEGVEAPRVAAGAGREVLLALDALDGAARLDANVAAATVFSVLPRTGTWEVTAQDFLQPGSRQIAAGYALYGPSTALVLTTGGGVNGFTLDAAMDDFVLTHPDVRIPHDTHELGIDASNERFWEPPVRRYVEECVSGREGPRGADFEMRWVGSTIADLHRVLLRGGVFLVPRDSKLPARSGRLRLLFEAAPAALVVEQAGGLASTGRRRILDIVPGSLDDRAPVILGSRDEVERLVRYHALPGRADRPYTSPLFNERSLLRER